MPTYSLASDMLLGGIPTPVYADKDKYVQDATDEVDSYIGFLYQTPVDVTSGGPTPRPVRLLLKRIANDLATGRYIMAVSGGGQRNTVHAYGKELVDQACAILKKISEGDIVLQDVPLLSTATPVSSPLIFNVDDESQVEAYYDRVVTPRTTAGLVSRVAYTELYQGRWPW